MSVLVRKDPRVLACREPTWTGALFAMLWRHMRAAAVLMLLAALTYSLNIWLGLYAAAQTSGTMSGLPVYRDVRIVRDARGIAHIAAANEHDLFFAQGFAEGSDRLFEMDLARRYAYGQLATVFGARALALDEQMRAADLRGIAAREWHATDARTRAVLQAFSDGVNAAETRQPLPVEFRMLLYEPAHWAPQDSIAISLVAALELGDSWYDVVARDNQRRTLGARCFDLAFPLSDPRYDVSVGGRMLHGRSRGDTSVCDGAIAEYGNGRPRIGSNAWAAGSQRTTDHHALVANDPHVDLTIPGVWYAIDLHAPGFHAAGTVIPGLPGVALGHNERIAWAVTNAEVATSSVYRAPDLPARYRVVERFAVRFGSPVTKIFYRTPDTFSITAGEDGTTYLVRWPQYAEPASTIPTLLAIDRAKSIAGAMRALAAYHGAPQNFIVADTGGAIAYHLAGALYDDPAWGRYVHPARDLRIPLRIIPFGALPAHAPSRSAVLLTANNRPYGRGYPYRLSAAFEPPYRAYRIAEILKRRRTYDLAYFEHMQMDACSPIDAEIARDVEHIVHSSALAGWNGCFDPSSRTAALEHAARETLLSQRTSLAVLLAQLRRPAFNARSRIEQDAAGALWTRGHSTWARAGRVSVEHPLSPYWYGLLRGKPLPGDGDEYTIHLQEPGFAQGFRAVWDVGNWEAGGIMLPSGESGEPGSGHYDDLASAWIDGRIAPLPFSTKAVARATAMMLVLTAGKAPHI